MSKPIAKLLIAGVAGFIGSITEVVLMEAGNDLLMFDDFSNSSPNAIDHVRELTGPAAVAQLRRMQNEIRKPSHLEQAFTKMQSMINALVNFTGLEAFGESVQKALHYWHVSVSDDR